MSLLHTTRVVVVRCDNCGLPRQVVELVRRFDHKRIRLLSHPVCAVCRLETYTVHHPTDRSQP